MMEQREHAINMTPILKVVKEQLIQVPLIIQCLDTHEPSNQKLLCEKQKRQIKVFQSF